MWDICDRRRSSIYLYFSGPLSKLFCELIWSAVIGDLKNGLVSDNVITLMDKMYVQDFNSHFRRILVCA